MKKALYLAVLLIFALSLAACGGQPTPTTVVPPATATPVSPPALTLETLKNAEYQSEFPASKKARLTDGQYQEDIVPGSATKLNIVLYPMAAFGDLNGDGVDDAAAVLVADPGGSGTFYYLVAVVNQNGTPKHVASVLLGDRVRFKSISIQAGEIVVNMVQQALGDPMCCPTMEVTQKYKLQGDKLVPIS